MSRHATVPFGQGEKTLHIERFRGMDVGSLLSGQLTDAHNVHILSGGALHSMLAEQQIPLADSAPLGGVYTLCDEYDADYETRVNADWVYENLCPKSVLQYNKGLETTARLSVADVGMPGKQNGAYRRVISAFSEGDRLYVFYDAVYNLIDQRRYQEYEKVGSGIVSTFYTEDDGEYYAAVCTLTQLWVDCIDARGRIESRLVDAYLRERGRLDSPYDKATLVQKGTDPFHYISSNYIPQLGAAYSGSPDRVYTDIYPTLATRYAAESALTDRDRRAVRCYNRDPGEGELGAVGEKLLLLPDMQLLAREDGWSLTDVSAALPQMTAAVQHFDRLFGIYGSHLYASAAGNCADFGEGTDASAAWHTVTPDGGGFTAILSFDGQVVVFTERSMLTVRGSELPFTLSYVGAWGCPRAEAAVALGDWLYFVSGNDLLRYNGSRVESIGRALMRDLVLADAILTAADGKVAVSVIGFDGVLFYDPASESWSARRGATPDRFLGETMLAGGALYRLFAKEGDFAADVCLGSGTRRRITSVTFTAYLAPQSILRLEDADGNVLLRMDEVYGETATHTAAVHTLYNESEPLRLTGSGEVILYGITLRYAPLRHI